MEYSVGVSNRFAMFIGEEDDPGDMILPESPTKAEKSDKDKKKGDPKTAKGKAKEIKKEKGPLPAGKKPGNEAPSKPEGDKSSGNRGDRQRSGRPPAQRGDREEGKRREGFDSEFRGDRDNRPPRGRGGGRPRLSSREKDKENESGGKGGYFGGDRDQDRGEGRSGSRGRGGRAPFRVGRGGERGGGGGGGGGERGGGFRVKREFERRSGSDKSSSVKAVDKREGGGAHNWGKAEDVEPGQDDWPAEESEEQTQAQPQPDANANEETTAVPAEEEKGEKEGEDTPVEEEVKEMTLDEYKALHSAKTIKADSSVRRAGENVDTSQWKGAVMYERKEEDYFKGTREIIEKPKTSGRVKTTVQSNFFFQDPARRGGKGRGGSGPPSRGGRGGFESRPPREGGERRRGGFEGGRKFGGGRDKGDRAPNMEDESDFPSLTS